jgi:hypothetical protein
MQIDSERNPGKIDKRNKKTQENTVQYSKTADVVTGTVLYR